MTDDTSTPKFHDPSFEAKFRGQTLGYFSTADEAQAALDAAQEQMDQEMETDFADMETERLAASVREFDVEAFAEMARDDLAGKS